MNGTLEHLLWSLLVSSDPFLSDPEDATSSYSMVFVSPTIPNEWGSDRPQLVVDSSGYLMSLSVASGQCFSNNAHFSGGDSIGSAQVYVMILMLELARVHTASFPSTYVLVLWSLVGHMTTEAFSPWDPSHTWQSLLSSDKWISIVFPNVKYIAPES